LEYTERQKGKLSDSCAQIGEQRLLEEAMF
jgi:hypothetical protein